TNPCTTDVCNGTVGAPACTHPAGNAGATCRAATGQCDVAEACTGASSVCPPDAFKSSTASCTGTSQGSACDDDGADHCAGTSDLCIDVFRAATEPCRVSQGPCDVTESCTGTSA